MSKEFFLQARQEINNAVSIISKFLETEHPTGTQFACQAALTAIADAKYSLGFIENVLNRIQATQEEAGGA